MRILIKIYRQLTLERYLLSLFSQLITMFYPTY